MHVIKSILVTVLAAACAVANEWSGELDAKAFDVKFAGGRLAGCGAYVNARCKAKNVDAKLVAAIMAQESGWGKSALARRKNNFGGLKGKGGWMSFKTREAGIDYLVDLIARKYRGQSLVAMQRTYGGGTSGWASRVAAIKKGIR